MRLAALFSGGKDSVAAAWDCIRKGHEVKYLITMVPESQESYMFHYPNLEHTSLQAEAMGIAHIFRTTKGEKEKELEDLRKAINPIRNDIEGLVAGGLASRYQADRIKAVAESFGLQFLAPFWKAEPLEYWRMLLKEGFKIMMIGVSCEGLGKEWLGKVIDEERLEKLAKLAEKYKFHLGGEGGEFETFVLDCPLFRKRVEVLKGEAKWKEDSGFYFIRKARLAESKDFRLFPEIGLQKKEGKAK